MAAARRDLFAWTRSGAKKLSQLFGAQAADKRRRARARNGGRAGDRDAAGGHPDARFRRDALIDVDSASPLETSIEPLLEASELLCVRLDMPLGMLLEEITLPPAASADAAASGTVAVAWPGSSTRARRSGRRAPRRPRARDDGGDDGDVLPGVAADARRRRKAVAPKVLFAPAGAPFDTIAAITSSSAERQGGGQVVCLVERGGPGDFDRLREAGVSPISPLSRRPSAEGAQPDAG